MISVRAQVLEMEACEARVKETASESTRHCRYRLIETTGYKGYKSGTG